MDTRPVDPLQRVKELCPLVALLRRGDQYAERLQIRRQWLDFAAEKHRDRLAAQKAKTDHTSLPVHEGGLSDETIAKIEQKLNLL
jgi:hypothetical protein